MLVMGCVISLRHSLDLPLYNCFTFIFSFPRKRLTRDDKQLSMVFFLVGIDQICMFIFVQ